jgi:hypothetical protein
VTEFYRSLKTFREFHRFTDDSLFSELPADWSVVITDIRGSTKAISEGRYKDVNTIGAACIVVARKALGKIEVPFVFGGDGATLLVPQEHVSKVCEDLASLKTLSQENFDLELRVGVVPFSELQILGHSIQVGKFELTPGRSIAILRGDGVSAAEKIIKNDSAYEYRPSLQKEISLEGLSCRWNPIPSKRGKILTVLVVSRAGAEVYVKVMEKLTQLFPDGINGANPVNMDVASYKSTLQLLRDEKKLHGSVLSKAFMTRALEILYGVLVFKYKFPAIFFDAKAYAASMQTHSDFRKFDDTLRMVLDCSLSEITSIKAFLEQGFLAGELYYGTFEADSSLMTCFVEGLGQGQHIHFIDSENGGYAAAAVELKRQMKSVLAAF